MNARILLKAGREKALLNGHPWVFSGAIARVEGEPGPGDPVEVIAARGAWLGTAAYSPSSQIRARVMTRDERVPLDGALWRRRIHESVARREGAPVCRLVYGESDGLPGLVADRYGDFVVMQLLAAGPEPQRALIAEALAESAGARGVYERSDVDVRRKEGLPERHGLAWGEEPPERLMVDEPGPVGATIHLPVDVRGGHKTGIYLDQRENRRWIGERAGGKRVLNLFAYTGAFAAHAYAGGASLAVNVDASRPALELARETLRANGREAGQDELVRADVFEDLRARVAAGEKWDIIVLDPPKLAFSRAQVDRAARAYKDLNRLALELLAEGGLLATFSCSGLVSPDLFQKIVFSASVEAGREARITRRFTQPEDHPVLLTFPEAEYLKGLLCRC